MIFIRILFLLIISVGTFAQRVDNKNVTDIPTLEMQGHLRLDNPQVHTGASANFDVKHYRCEWEVDPAIRYISGKVTVFFRMTSPGNSISLDLMNSGLTTDSVTYHGVRLPILHNHDVLEIDFPVSLGLGTFDSVSISYHGIPPTSGFGSFVQTTHAGVPVIWTLSEPYGSRDWWPCKNGLDDKTDSIDVFITSPDSYSAASNGLLQDQIITGNKKVTHWKHNYPIATYLVCFAVTNYTVFNNSVQLGAVTLPMVTYCYPESLASFQANTPLVLDALKLYHNTFGDYPFLKEKYGHVQFSWGGGQEHQTSTFIVAANEGLMAHELAHQWFGDKVTCKSWADIWLNEGFATFLASYYSELKYPGNIITTRKNEIAGITSLPDGSVWVDDTTNVNRIFNGRLSYNKGSHLLYMLRWKLGDSAFFGGLRTYLTDPALSYGFASTDDLKRNLEHSGHQDLTQFFRDWFYGQGYPSYQVKWSQLSSAFVKINMSQTTSHPSVNFFAMPVALKFKNALEEKTIIMNNTTNGQVIFSNIGFIADTVIIDPEYWLISRSNISKKLEDSVTGINNIQVFPNPAHTELYIYFRNFNLPSLSLRMVNALGQVVLQKNISINRSDFVDLPIGYLHKGTYFLTIESGDKIRITKKIEKE